MIAISRPDTVGGGAVAEIFSDRHGPATFGGGGGVVREFFSSNWRSRPIKFREIVGHFRDTWRSPAIHCAKKNIYHKFGGGHGPLPPPPPRLRHWSSSMIHSRKWLWGKRGPKEHHFQSHTHTFALPYSHYVLLPDPSPAAS